MRLFSPKTSHFYFYGHFGYMYFVVIQYNLLWFLIRLFFTNKGRFLDANYYQSEICLSITLLLQLKSIYSRLPQQLRSAYYYYCIVH